MVLDWEKVLCFYFLKGWGGGKYFSDLDYIKFIEMIMVMQIKFLGFLQVYGYGKNKKVVVEGIIMNIYEGQIMVLLGYNGVGKIIIMLMFIGIVWI